MSSHRIFGAPALGLVLTVTLAPIALGQPYTIRYDAAVGRLPNATCWTSDSTGGTATVSAGVLTLSSGTQNHVHGFQVPVTLASPVVIEFRARRITGTTSSVAREHLGIYITTATNHGALFFVGPDVVFLTNALNSRGPQAIVDTDQMHTYRIEVSGGSVSVFHDGALILTGSTYTSVEFGSPGIGWGDFTNGADGISQWEYFQHNSSSIVCATVPGMGLPGAAALAVLLSMLSGAVVARRNERS